MKAKTIYTCQNCGSQSAKWLGKCPDCNSWNSMVEETYADEPAKDSERVSLYTQEPVLLKDVALKDTFRVKTQIGELDRVLGGGIVPGSVVLIGGDPGVGKSTISLQVSHQMSGQGKRVLYVSGEESITQTKMRAQRIGKDGDSNLFIVNQTDLSLILEYINKVKPDLVVIDSIQVIFDPRISSSPGSVSQVRECAGTLTQYAKANGVTILIIGHVTKEGSLAGPRVLEHMVDTVLYFEGDRFALYRILRAVKNRFGSTNEIGVFEMCAEGLKDVDNPSQLFLSERPKDVPGSVVVPVLEGTRPLLVEVQSLVSKSNFGYPSRRAQGFDLNRMGLLAAVLEKRMGLHLETEDIFINVAGGIKIEEAAADLAVAVAIASAFREEPVVSGVVVIGEVGLSGEIRSISQTGIRISEAQKLGFTRCVLPLSNHKNLDPRQQKKGMELIPVSTLKEALDIILRR